MLHLVQQKFLPKTDSCRKFQIQENYNIKNFKPKGLATSPTLKVPEYPSQLKNISCYCYRLLLLLLGSLKTGQ